MLAVLKVRSVKILRSRAQPAQYFAVTADARPARSSRYRGITSLYFLHSGIPNAKDGQRVLLCATRGARLPVCYPAARTALKSAYPGEQ